MSKSKELTDVGKDIVAQEQSKPKKYKNRGAPPPNAKMVISTNEDRALVSKLLSEVLVEYKKPRVKSDEELAQRFSDYFKHCSEVGQIPTVEEMCMATGYSYFTCYDWETGKNKGFSSETSQIVKKAKEFLKTFDAKLVISGKMNFLAYCFRAKNYYGMVDKAEYVVTPNVPQDTNYDAAAIRERYLIDAESKEV